MPPPLAEGAAAPHASRADFAACRALLCDGSRTFHAASYLLPRRVRTAACALYAFCRVADDAVDRGVDPAAALAAMRARLDAVYAGTPHADPVDRAFADVVARHGIPRTLPDALLEGFAWDVERRQYDELAELEAYAARVAGTVGAMMSLLMGTTGRDALARACDLGVAMQLSNIARDVGEDARAGRLYLPRRWLADAGIAPDAWLAAPAASPALAGVVERLLGAADVLYERAAGGIPALPPECRPAIRSARTLYAEIGNEVRRRGCDAVTGRAVVSGSRKVRLLVRAWVSSSMQARAEAVPPLAATRFLVEAASRATPREAPAGDGVIPWWNLAARVTWSLELFERLERREHAARASSQG